MNDNLDPIIQKLHEKLGQLWQYLSIDTKKMDVARLDEESIKDDFWKNQEKAKSTLQNKARLEEEITKIEKIKVELQDISEFADLAREDETLAQELETKLTQLEKDIHDLEFHSMLSDEHDINNAIMSINAGAGGTESCDWASMLLRMYLRYAEQKGFRSDVIDSLPGDGAGFKNVTFTISGNYAYGFLKAEIGVHRLVRISPFDSNKRRHTSFASVYVYPEVEDDIEIEINESDLRIDTYRSSGAGGQHVNVTDSAVRITHIPTNTVVACQNERSQHKNRATAMKILKAKLYQLEREKKEEELAKKEGEKKDISWGSQIRSYVLQPYQLIKDHRTGYEEGNVQKVLDGELDNFIEKFLFTRLVKKA